MIEAFYAAGKQLGAVCYAPGIFRHDKGSDGQFLVNGKRVTGFSNSEEAAVGLTDILPFLVEDMLQANGATYSNGSRLGCNVVVDGNLITGQNLASSKALLAPLA